MLHLGNIWFPLPQRYVTFKLLEQMWLWPIKARWRITIPRRRRSRLWGDRWGQRPTTISIWHGSNLDAPLPLLVLEKTKCNAIATLHLFDGERPLSQYWLMSSIGEPLLSKWWTNGQVKAMIDKLRRHGWTCRLGVKVPCWKTSQQFEAWFK